jgi:hypothetical protein
MSAQREAGMHSTTTTNENIRTLWRIVALLVSFAGFAERAAGRSAAVRFAVLFVLRPAEAIARGHVAAVTGVLVPGPSQDSVDEALGLAAAFRALAALLAAFAAAAGLARAVFPRPGARAPVPHVARGGAGRCPRRDSS